MPRGPRKQRTASLHDEAYALFVRAMVERRIKSGKSQQAVADALGWDQSTIARIESVQRRLDIIELIRIADAVGFDPARLVREIHQQLAQGGKS
jgi:transcriptional regulator with XRE-family HTH domain